MSDEWWESKNNLNLLGKMEDGIMSTHLMAQDRPTRPHLASVLLSIFLLFTPVDGNANGESHDDLTMSVLIKGSVWVTVGDLAEYVRAFSVKDKTGIL
jgi:hypothetical protein